MTGVVVVVLSTVKTIDANMLLKMLLQCGMSRGGHAGNSHVQSVASKKANIISSISV